MADDTQYLYEGMFLLTQSAIGADPSAGTTLIQDFLDRARAETVCLSRWDERKLAYPIGGQKRGTYYRALFRAKGPAIAHIERDCNLSEDVLRVLMLRADHMGEIEVNAAIEEAKTATTRSQMEGQPAPAEPAAEAPVAAAE